MMRLSILAVGVTLAGGCQEPSDDGACFPLPEPSTYLVLSPAMETRGSSLQGGEPGEHEQGTTLQGEELQGIEYQGTSLQGDEPGEDMQSTTLQGGAPGDDVQGTTLQGGAPGEDIQGTSLQGTSPQGGAPGEDLQGTSLQGTSPQGGPDERAIPARNPAYRGIADLDGARLVLALDPSVPIALKDGQLVASGIAGTAALRGVPIGATTADGRAFSIEIVTTAVVDGVQHVELQADGRPVCGHGEQGVFVAGRWEADGAHVADPELVTFSCMDGVIAKCVSWGYAPWLVDAPTHAACTRLARADYCGTGVPWTLDGTAIQIYDQVGVRPDPVTSRMPFEAAWTAAGAACIARPRYAIHDDAGAIVPTCFASLPHCASLAEAADLGAMIANRSTPTPIPACE